MLKRKKYFWYSNANDVESEVTSTFAWMLIEECKNQEELVERLNCGEKIKLPYGVLRMEP